MGIHNELKQRIPFLQALVGATSRIKKHGLPVTSAPSRKLAEVPEVGQLLKSLVADVSPPIGASLSPMRRE